MGCYIDQGAEVYKRITVNLKKEHPKWAEN
jgi:hypothetical protein